MVTRRRMLARRAKMSSSPSPLFSSSALATLAVALLVILAAISTPSADAQQVQQQQPQAPTNPPFQQKQAEEEQRRIEADRGAKKAAMIAEANGRGAKVEQEPAGDNSDSSVSQNGQNQNQNQQKQQQQPPPQKVLNAQDLKEQHAQRQADADQRREEMERRRAEMNRQQQERQAERERVRAEAEQRRVQRQAEAEMQRQQRQQQQQQQQRGEATEGQKAGLSEELVERQKQRQQAQQQQAQQQQAQQQQRANAGTTASASANAKTTNANAQPNNTPGKMTKKKVVGPIELCASNFDSSMRDGSAWLIEFYAPWCGHCKRFAATYEKVAETLHSQSHAEVTKNPNARTIKVAKVDGSADRALASRFNIRGYPTFFLVDGWNVYEFEGDRTLEDLVDFATEDYLDYEPIPFVNSPFGPMGQLRALFIWAGSAAMSSFDWMVNKKGFSEVVAAMIMMGAAIVVGLFLIIFIGLMSVAKPKVD